jgi:hypothetical protein
MQPTFGQRNEKGLAMSKQQTFQVPIPQPVKTQVPDDGSSVALVSDVLVFTSGVTPPPVVVVTVSGPATVLEGAQAQYSAHVTGTADTRVIWSASDGAIDANGLFTAPIVSVGETVTIKAASVASPASVGSLPVSITIPSGRTRVFPSGGNDSSQVLAAAAKGPIQLSAGPNGSTFQFGPNTTFVSGHDVLQDDGTEISDMSGYGTYDRMIVLSGGKLTGSGSPNAGVITMPNCYARNLPNTNQDTNQYNHGVQVTGIGSVLTGLRTTRCGGDGVYINGATGFTVDVVATENIRNGGSATDDLHGGTVSGTYQNQHNSNAGISCGFDIEPNRPGACVITLKDCKFLDNTGKTIVDGLRLSIERLAANSVVKIAVINCDSRRNATNYHSTVASIPPGWSVTGSGNLDEGKPTTFPN